MASVPELAICYHQNGVVQGYELLKTHDIFLLKGVSEDGTPAFHPHVVQQNGLSVLRFLQENYKQDPGAYLVLHALLLCFSFSFSFFLIVCKLTIFYFFLNLSMNLVLVFYFLFSAL